MINFKSARKQSAQVGRRGENAACKFLESRGMTILARNWKCRAGELDIVALDENELVFAEVKTLRSKSGFDPAVNLSYRQRRRNFTAAGVYMKSLDIFGHPARFDLIEVICGRFFIRRITCHRNYLPPLPPREL